MGSDMYFIEFQSYKDKIKNAKSFQILVTEKDSTAGVLSSLIPIEVIDEVMIEVELVRNENNGISIWKHDGDGRIITFPPGTIKKIDITFY